MTDNSLITEVSRVIVLLFGIAVCVVSAWAMLVPKMLRQLVTTTTDETWGYYFAAAVRVVLGLALIFAASGSRFPTAFQIVGWLALIAAVGLLIIGQERLRKLVDWFNALSDKIVRAWLVMAVAFGLFLIYGAM